VTDTLAQRERLALCDLALSLDPETPTLCGDWDVSDLLAHLIVRERRPLAAGGIMVPALAKRTERAMAREAEAGVPAMVDRLRSRLWTPYAVPLVARYAQTLEYFVHHEDIRRAQRGWQPRELPTADLDELWHLIGRAGAFLGRGLPAPTRLARADRPGNAITFKRGADPVTVTGDIAELVLWVYGRSQVRGLSFDGPELAVRRLRGSNRAV
jgi:uncharacterized protein (TIGR03085 family)